MTRNQNLLCFKRAAHRKSNFAAVRARRERRRRRRPRSDKRRFMPPVYIPAKITAATRELLSAHKYTRRADYNASKTRRRALFRLMLFILHNSSKNTQTHARTHHFFSVEREKERITSKFL
jgi:hypothetical protein